MKIILGTMTFSDQVRLDVAIEMINAFRQTGFDEIDTAYVYHNGETESLLGSICSSGQLEGTRLAGKANPNVTNGLSPGAVRTQLNTSLDRLNLSSFDLFYLHSPDLSVPIRDTLQAVASLYDEGKFVRFGLSNYAAWQVAEIMEICQQEGWIAPSVYQGMYNALTRDVERELFPCLRHYGLSFYAYNPLAGGMLSGKYQPSQHIPENGRFATFSGYQDRYWKPEYLNTISELSTSCKTAGIEPAEAAIRWLRHHSALNASEQHPSTNEHPTTASDGIILGASSIPHLSQNIAASRAGPLPDDLLEVFESGWDTVRSSCIKYFRP